MNPFADNTANENKAAAEPAKGTSTPKEPPAKAAHAHTKSDSEDEDEVHAHGGRSRYYRRLKLPTGEKVDITKRNQFIKEWAEKRLKCDPRPYYMLGAATVLLLLLLYVYAYHQAFIYNLFGSPGEQPTPANQEAGTLSDTGNDESTL
ncbi:hypothetical protein MTO96_002062 [Rhipicephalus appendiculatus]